MLILWLIAVLPFTQTQTTVNIPKAETSNEFIDRFNVIAEGIAEAVGVMSNCSNSIFEKFVKGEKDATFANLKGCVKDKVDFEKSFKTPLKNYQEQFKKLVEAEEAALNTVLDMFTNSSIVTRERVNATRTSLKEKADKIGAKLEQFGKNMLTKLKEFGVTVKESDFVQGMKKAMDDMKERVKSMFEKVKNFFEW